MLPFAMSKKASKKVSLGRTKASREAAKKRKKEVSEKILALTTLQALAYDQAMAQSQSSERQAKELEKQAATLRKEGSRGLEVAMHVILAEHKMDTYPFSPCGIEPLRDEEGRIQQLKFSKESK